MLWSLVSYITLARVLKLQRRLLHASDPQELRGVALVHHAYRSVATQQKEAPQTANHTLLSLQQECARSSSQPSSRAGQHSTPSPQD